MADSQAGADLSDFPDTTGQVAHMLRPLCLSLLLGFSFVSSGTSEFIANKPQSSLSGQSQERPSAATPGPVQVSPAAETSTGLAAAQPDPLGEAKELYRKGNFDAAIQKYQQIIQERPRSPDAYAGLARVHLKKKDVQRAYETVNKGLQGADSAPVHVALGEVYFRQGKIHEAEIEWVNVINSGHQDARAYMGLARVRWAMSMYRGGWTMIDRAHQLDSTELEIRQLWVGKVSRAERIKYLEEYLAGKTNDDPETRTGMQHYLEYLQARAKDPRGACHLVSKATTTETQLVRLLLDPKHLRGYGLSVGVNAEKSNLLLDTGASGILINRKLAEKAGVTRLSDIDIGGIGDKGNRGGYMGMANSLKVGELEFQDCPVRVLEQRSVAGEDGLIGADVFASFLVDIDFPNEKLHLRQLPKRPEETVMTITLQTEKDDSDSTEEQPTDKTGATPAKSAGSAHSGPQDRYIAPEMKSYTQIYRFGHALLVPTFIGGVDAPAKLFLLDTGAFNNQITPAAAGEVTHVRGDTDTIVKGVSGSVKNVYRADKAVIQFGHLRQENQDLVAFDLTHISDRIGTEVSGLLGFAMLRFLDIKIDYRDGLVDFSYDPKRWNY